jgi:hypothetical protein
MKYKILQFSERDFRIFSTDEINKSELIYKCQTKKRALEILNILERKCLKRNIKR